MELSRAGIAIIAGACISAGAGAGYLATRGVTPTVTAQSVETAAASPAAQVPEPTQAAAPPTFTADRIIAESRPAPPPRTSPVPQPERPRVRPRSAPEQPPAPATILAPEQPAFETEINPVVPAGIASNPPEFHLPAPIAEPAPNLVELELPVDSVIGLQLETPVSSETAAVEDEVIARVTRDVKVGGHVAIPAGTAARGEVILVERGGKIRERARLGVRFTSVVLSDGTHVPIETEAIYRDGDSPGRESAAKIGGGAIGGAIIGGILGGGKGAAIGGSIGAGAGSTAVLAGGRNPATLPAGAPVTIRLQERARVLAAR